jgi:hypothetical protein
VNTSRLRMRDPMSKGGVMGAPHGLQKSKQIGWCSERILDMYVLTLHVR